MQVRDRHADEHWALKRLGGDFTGREKGRRCSLDSISKVYLNRHQKSKLTIKFHLYLSDSHHQKNEKDCHMGVKIAKVYVFFTCYPMEPFISGVRPSNTQKSSKWHCLNDFLSRNEHRISSNSRNLPLDI